MICRLKIITINPLRPAISGFTHFFISIMILVVPRMSDVKEDAVNKDRSNAASTVKTTNIRYEDCRKNHGARMGKHATDGCLEFMASDAENLKCDVCGCHRNFHTKKLVRAEETSRINSEVKYEVCCKNHAVRMGKYSSSDGCLEFMASEGEAGSRDALMCAACGCHRNFHKKIEEKEEVDRKRPALSPPSYAGGAAYYSSDDFYD
ncbi:uncharacterized protein LOC130761175 [Actinidia eriantha]|uniref:uncharacterized protein LOC130761175 n=1 Tax=Actinidia eriantha TaxID=165200 RepID=UPI002590A7F5|nr:uncharacterized protein LOC130761175 [Actinidia eriantha]